MSSDHSSRAVEGPPRSTQPGSHDGLRILLVEDHPDTKLGMEILLRRAGHVVRSADRARQAFEIAGREPFDIVITDIGLPDMGGAELMTKLHEWYGLKAIVTSGYGGESSLIPRGPAFIYHLTKPINMDQLRSLLLGIKASKRTDAAE